ncbi:MAG: glycosyltransferase [Actinomycetota bacterium]|nr:glycosyltransferase [Actinomycetota bacterium]
MSGYTFDHLLTLSTAIGTFEHADHTGARPEHGYCTDDMARVLVVTCREPDPSQAVLQLSRTACRFVAEAQDVVGRIRNRRSETGRWLDRHGVEDCWGRSLWGFGTAARRSPVDHVRQMALAYFGHGVQQRSPHRRAMAFAALGAAEVLTVDPRHERARRLVRDAAEVIGRPGDDPAWRWPEARLSYANAALAEALVVAGDVLERPDLLADGLAMLEWLLERETLDGHLSPTPAGGAGPGDTAPRFDQQPIEVAAMADASRRAAIVTGDAGWERGTDAAVAWFEGDNDASAAMGDPASGGGYDGLRADGPNLNQGAESTLALISTLQLSASRAAVTV